MELGAPLEVFVVRKLGVPGHEELAMGAIASGGLVVLSDALLHEHLRRLVGSLPDATRMIVLLRYQEDLGPAEIAKVLGMQVNTVKSQLHRAIETLRAKAAQLHLER